MSETSKVPQRIRSMHKGVDIESTTELAGVKLTEPLYFFVTSAYETYIGFAQHDIGLNVEVGSEEYEPVLKAIPESFKVSTHADDEKAAQA